MIEEEIAREQRHEMCISKSARKLEEKTHKSEADKRKMIVTEMRESKHTTS